MIERLLAGEAALASNELDAADRLFGQVADADPRNAIAVVGQARVAIRRGDVERGRLLAGQALVIDPDEAAASRLLAELDRQSGPGPGPAPLPDVARAAAPQPAAEPAPAAAVAGHGWRAWLERLLRRG
jgi:thioredoxin-like negative regulator of GroEL